jgi:hypothetical protein
MRVLTAVGLILLVGCSAEGSEAPLGKIPKLEVTERSATTLLLRWDAMGTTNNYTVDYLTGVAQCSDFPTHGDILPLTGTTTLLTGLSPATRYHIHVHPLPSGSQKSNTVFVLTLAAGAPSQAVTAADYQICN